MIDHTLNTKINNLCFLRKRIPNETRRPIVQCVLLPPAECQLNRTKLKWDRRLYDCPVCPYHLGPTKKDGFRTEFSQVLFRL